LIRRVVESSKVPVMKHFTGNCYVYIDKSADFDLALRVILNAKCQRPGVCNACESLLIHRDIAAAFVPQICAALIERGVEVRGDSQCRELAEGVKSATEEDWSKEYLDLVISVAITESVESAIEHINRYGSHHTDAIVARETSAIQLFSKLVDSAAVMVNTSTRFHDGGEFGLGAEIGISTDKFHARGPCGLRELTSYKYVCVGNGQIRE
jgi:glutamate-5-semialdehyde dehydrogenase